MLESDCRIAGVSCSQSRNCPFCNLGPRMLSYLPRMPMLRGGNRERNWRVRAGNVGLFFPGCRSNILAVNCGVSAGGC